jgi:phosphate/sulfate permease
MSHHATRTRQGPAEVATLVVLAALLIGAVAGIPLAWLAITGDPATTAHTIVLAAVVVAIAVDLIWMARSARGLLRPRGQR